MEWNYKDTYIWTGLQVYNSPTYLPPFVLILLQPTDNQQTIQQLEGSNSKGKILKRYYITNVCMELGKCASNISTIIFFNDIEESNKL